MGEPNFWKPKTKTEHELWRRMEREWGYTPSLVIRDNQFRMFGPKEPKGMRADYLRYHELRRRGYTHESHPDLDLEMLLEKVRRSIVTFEDIAEQPGKEFDRGIMDATYMFLMDIIHLHEAKKKLKRELEEGA